ncbi:MAG: GNAT family N-acetyltransferase [Angelakisella sp.]|jgi:RimJ/RimL family protein N-acetyltransferase|nr:GNAT family N-acetyltransferase [Angelakisella sp.]
MSFSIEKARPEDAAALIEYLRVVGGESDNLTFGAEGLPATVEEETAFLEKSAADTRSVILLAKEDGEIIGDGHIEAFSRRLSHRAGLGITVRKAAWGRGVGTAIMERLIAHAREQGIEIIELQVRSDNARAIRLYEKFGFVKIGHYPGFLKVDGVYADCDLMNLYL